MVLVSTASSTAEVNDYDSCLEKVVKICIQFHNFILEI